ncbi:hypothetical protein HY413_00315 [Candidatus Kaiserbacteria bacterium]|nr:hypothetical protein [Candidatus Kaiserbacteria bacterium]
MAIRKHIAVIVVGIAILLAYALYIRPLLATAVTGMLNCSPSTPEEVSQGFPGIRCDSDRAAVSDASITAKQYLKTLPRQFAGSSSYDCKTYGDKNIDRLDPAFAVCAATFLKAFTDSGGKVTITSAHRSPQDQVCVCKGETGMCGRALPVDSSGRPIGGRGVGHQYGTAMDIRSGNASDADYSAMQNFARTHPQFGIHFPFGMRDRPHMEPATARCSTGGYSVGNLSLTERSTQGAATNASSGLLSSVSNLFRPNEFNMLAATPPSSLPTTPSNPVDAAYEPATETNPPTSYPSANFSLPSSAQKLPLTPEAVLTHIAVGPPRTPNIATTSRPLTEAERQRFYEQQTTLYIPSIPASAVIQGPPAIPPINLLPFAGFVPTEALRHDQPIEFLRYYVLVLTRVTLAINEILRIMGNEPEPIQDGLMN